MSDKPKTALELLSDPNKWARGFYAYDSSGLTCCGTEPQACKWCMVGALQCVYLDRDAHNGEWTQEELDRLDEMYAKVMDVLKRKYAFTGNMANWNDTPNRTHAEVLEVLQEAGV